MPPAGRIADISFAPRDAHGTCDKCPHPVLGPAFLGSPNVLINGRSALRVGDRGAHALCCNANLWQASLGSPSVFINNKPAHRMFDLTAHCGGPGALVTGSPDVIVGGGYDLKGLLVGLASSQIGGLAANQMSGPLGDLGNQLSTQLGLGPMGVSALQGALNGAVAGAVSGAVAGGIYGGVGGVFSGAVGGLGDGALNGAINGAAAGLWDELSYDLSDARGDVMRDMAGLSDEELSARVSEMMGDAEIQADLQRSLDGGFYGSELHQRYGATVEYLTGGRISAEQAMALNPSGGITGPGMSGLELGGPVGNHAVRHDAQGYLFNNFSAGPGYGGLFPSFPGSGQIVGSLRELINPTDFPN